MSSLSSYDHGYGQFNQNQGHSQFNQNHGHGQFNQNQGYGQFNQPPYGLGKHPVNPPQFMQKLNTLKYQHAVVFCGQHLLHLIMRTLIRGDISNISGVLKAALSSKTQYKNSFTKDELNHLGKGNHKSYDITLLFKIVQKICGLAPAGDDCWTQFTGGNGLEFLITTLKEMRNELVHNFGCVIDDVELENLLDGLTELAVKVTSALGDRAQELGTQLYVIQRGKHLSDIDYEAAETLKVVQSVIDDVKEKVNQTAVSESDDDSDEDEEDDEYEQDNFQFDSVPQPTGTEQVIQDPLLEKEFKDLTRKFWEYAGSKEAVV